MKKKKILKIVLIILGILLILFVANLARKTYIISKHSEQIIENSKITNFYKKMSLDEAISEIWRKGDKQIYKRTSEDGVRMICYEKENVWIIVNTIDKNGKTTRVVNKMKREDMMPLITIYSSFYAESLGEAIKLASMSMITTKEINGIECHRIYLAKDWQIFINKTNSLVIREINGNTDTGFVEYKINQVTDKDVELPNLDGYEIREIK